MGCGASKATQVANTEITIKEDTRSEPSVVGSQPQLVQSEFTGSDLRTEVRTQTQDQPPTAFTVQHREHEQAVLDGDDLEGRRKYEAFEVCMSHDGVSSPKGPPPRRLSKMESVPKLTSEMLAEKQKQVEERKAQELEKRANRRLSKKDRLWKQIVDARDLEVAQQHYTQIEKKQSVNSANRTKVQAEVVEKQRKREEHAKRVREKAHKLSTGELDTESGTASYDPSVEMDVDHTYNAEEQNEWESHSSGSNSNDRTLTSKHDDDAFFDDHKLEQYL